MSAPSSTAVRAAREHKPSAPKPFLSIGLARRAADLVTESHSSRVSDASIESFDRCTLHLAHALTSESPGETALLGMALIARAAVIADVESYEPVEGMYARYVANLAAFGAKLVRLASRAERAPDIQPPAG